MELLDRSNSLTKTWNWEKAVEGRRTLEFEAEERRRPLVEGYSAPRAIRDEPITVADAIEDFLMTLPLAD